MSPKGAVETITKFGEFFELVCLTDILNASAKGESNLQIEFSALSAFDPDLAEQLLDDPENTLAAAKLALENIELPGEHTVDVRFIKLPSDSIVMVSGIRTKHIGRLIQIEADIKKTSKVEPLIISCRFECPACGQVISVIQQTEKFEEPSRCGCGRKGRFRVLSKEMIDSQLLEISEPIEKIEFMSQPKTMDVQLRGSLCHQDISKYNVPGTRVIIVGIVHAVQYISRTSGLLNKQELRLEVHSILQSNAELSEEKITPEEERLFLDTDPVTILTSFAIEIRGYEKLIPLVKESIIYAACGGSPIYNDDGTLKRRGLLHVLLIGDPGTGKTQLIEAGVRLRSRSRMSSGKGSSGVGLTASVGKDEKYGYYLEAGLMMLCHGSMVGVDEFTAINKEDQDYLLTAMESGVIHINKASVHGTFKSETTVIAGANPESGKFNPMENIALQFNISPPLLSRFNLIWPFADLDITEQDDDTIADAVMDLHIKGPQSGEVPEKNLKKYITFVRNRFHPKINEDQRNSIKDWYKKLRAAGRAHNVIAITARYLNTAIKLSEAIARFNKSQVVLGQHVERAIELVTRSLLSIGAITDASTGQLVPDVMHIAGNPGAMNRINMIRDIHSDILKEIEGKDVDIGELQKRWTERCKTEGHIIKDWEFDQLVDKLKRSGDYFEPRHGLLQRL